MFSPLMAVHRYIDYKLLQPNSLLSVFRDTARLYSD